MNEGLAQLFPGVAAMANIHPLVVHFPIALLSIFFLLEITSVFMRQNERLQSIASGMLYFGTVGAAGAVAAGLWAEATVPHGEQVHAIMQLHKGLGLAVLSLAILLSLWRLLNRSRFSRVGRVVQLVLALVMVGAMVKGADLGGLMVYRYGVASQAQQGGGAEEQEHHHQHDDDDEDEPPEEDEAFEPLEE